MTLLDIALLLGAMGIISWFATKGRRRRPVATEERALLPGEAIYVNRTSLLRIPPAPRGATPHFLCFDTETTELFPRTEGIALSNSELPRIVALSYNLLDVEGQLILTESWLLSTSATITHDAGAIHGISREAVEAKGILPRKAYARFRKAFDKAKVLVAHNLAVHRALVEADMLSYALPALDWEDKGGFCTMEKGLQYLVAHDPYYTAAAPALRTLYGLLYYGCADLRYIQSNKSEADLLLATACLRFLHHEI